MKYELSLILRVIIAIALLSIPFNIFQWLFTQITVNFVYFVLVLIKAAPVLGKYSVKNTIDVYGVSVRIIELCVTASAYYTMAILTIITKDISILKRAALFLLGALLIFIMNLVRIFILIYILANNGDLFRSLHQTFWFLLSFVYVALAWILLSKVFKVENIPIYSDIKFLLQVMRKK